MIVYVVTSPGGGGVETVWSDPAKAIEVREALGRGAGVAVRPVDSDRPTAESNAALDQLRRLLAERKAK